MKQLFLFLALFPAFTIGHTQNATQNITGQVVDIETQQPLIGVNVLVIGSNPPIGTATDWNGKYELHNLPIGRQSLQFTCMGYEPTLFQELDLTSSKTLEMKVQMKESLHQLHSITVKPQFRKDRVQNMMASVSARTFSVEETSRYAGGWNDPARLAGAFAGVTMAEGVNDNAIVIRGNAPKGILWRLEGVEIPSPNHLNGVNNGGGIETIFSVNMLSNSDFYTGAFAAEYANALSEIFDLNFRNGTSQKKKINLQFGSQGIDIGSEGPLKKGGESSFLFNYRYSTLGLAGKLTGGDFGLPTYQDFSFKLHVPSQIYGDLSIWGIAGLSEVKFDPDKDIHEWENTFDNQKYVTHSDVAATGIHHQITTGMSGYLKTTIAFTWDYFSMKNEQWQRDNSIIPLSNRKESNKRLVTGTFYNRRWSNRHTNRTGVQLKYTYADFNIKGAPETANELVLLTNQTNHSSHFQIFSQSKIRLSEAIELTAGFSISRFNLTNETIMEPRISASWKYCHNQSITFAYGKHSRPEPIRFYKATDPEGKWINPDLKITKAHHYVASYDMRIRPSIRLKAEIYYQQLFDVPVIADQSYSLLNYRYDDYFVEPLNNSGTGFNQGIDITLESYLNKGIYYMITASLYDSKYKGGDKITRNTSYNRNYVVNGLAGKEWTTRTNHVLGLNTKIAWMGGNRFSPPDQLKSKQAEMVVTDESKAYEWQESPKIYIDLALSYKINRSKTSHILILQAKNLLMQSEMFGWAYDFEKQKVVKHGLAVAYPYLSYRIEF